MAITHHVVYVDESQSGGGRAFALAAMFVRHDAWFDAHRAFVDWRRWLARKYGLHMDKEVKATELIAGVGPWYGLALKRPTRHGIYRSALELVAGLAPAVRVLGVVVPDREDLALQRPFQEEAWRVLLQRVGRYCQEPPATCDLRVDNGAFPQLRKLTRKLRYQQYAPSAYAAGESLHVPLHCLVGDPAFINSADDYEVQLVDLVAYVALRSERPRGDFPPGMWALLGPARLGEANQIEREQRHSTEEPGLLVWPGRRIPKRL